MLCTLHSFKGPLKLSGHERLLKHVKCRNLALFCVKERFRQLIFKMEFLEDDLDILNIIENGFPRRIYQRANYFEEMDELTSFKRFRLTKGSVQNILPYIEDQLRMDDGMFG